MFIKQFVPMGLQQQYAGSPAGESRKVTNARPHLVVACDNKTAATTVSGYDPYDLQVSSKGIMAAVLLALPLWGGIGLGVWLLG